MCFTVFNNKITQLEAWKQKKKEKKNKNKQTNKQTKKQRNFDTPFIGFQASNCNIGFQMLKQIERKT